MLKNIFLLILLISKVSNSVIPRSANKNEDFDDLTIEMKISRRKEFMDFDDIDYESNEMETAEAMQSYPVQMVNDIRKFEYYPDIGQVGVKMVPVPMYYRSPQLQDQQLAQSLFLPRQLQSLSSFPFLQPSLPQQMPNQMQSLLDILSAMPTEQINQLASSMMPMMKMPTQTPSITSEQAMMMAMHGMHLPMGMSMPAKMMEHSPPSMMKAESKSQPPIIVNYCPPKTYAPSFSSYQKPSLPSFTKPSYQEHVVLQSHPAQRHYTYSAPMTTTEKPDKSWLNFIQELPAATTKVFSFTNPWFTLFDKLAKVKSALPSLPTFNVIGK